MRVVFILTMLMACKQEKKNTNGEVGIPIEKKEDRVVNVLEHPLIFEELGFKIESFTSEETDKDTFVLTITLSSSDDLEKYSKDHFFFIHAFDLYQENNDTDFINMDTHILVRENNTLRFKRTIKTDIYDYNEFRFGLVNRNAKERYFVRTLKEVSIKK